MNPRTAALPQLEHSTASGERPRAGRQAADVLLYTLHCGNFYGTERMALATLEGLEEYRRIVIAPPSTAVPSCLEMARARKYDVRSAQRPFEVLLALVPIFVRHRRIDVISTSALHNLMCIWLARLFLVRLRQLNVVHGGSDERYSYAKKFRLNGTAVGLVAVSAFVRRRLIAHAVRSERVVVIENFLTPQEVSARPRRAFFDPTRAGARQLDPSRVRVAVVCRLDPFKRLDILLDAVATGRLGSFDFAVHGTGELLASLRERAQALGGRVVFHGYESDVAARLTEADLFLHLCPDEPFGLVVLEAFAAGVPVIVPRSGGTDELVEEGISGLKYTPADPAALVSCLQGAALMAADRLDALVERGRATLAGRFSAAAGAEAYRQAFRRDLGR